MLEIKANLERQATAKPGEPRQVLIVGELGLNPANGFRVPT